MNKFLSNKYITLVSRIIVGAVFIFAAAEKISDPIGFAKAIFNYKLFPDLLINFFAVAIPWIELVAGILLVFGVAAKENAAIISSLLIIFIILVIISMSRGLNIDCGCFGTASGSKVGWQKVLENIVLLLLVLHIIYFDKGKPSLNIS